MQKNPGWISSQDFLSQHFSEGSVTHGSRVQLLPSGCAIRRGPGFIVLGQDESAPWQSLAAQNLVRTPVCPIFHGVDVELPGKAEQGKPDRNLEIRVTHGSRVQLHVPDVGDAGEVHHHPLEAQSEAGVAAGAVAP